uniref:Cationic amino acid transporter C-terminal domain-containing protein n=1 Tax=Spongospora subterranea TaxID=70186 RepID=A0A0H5RJU5_9EUKA|eukprot:CRZ08984.1 hypothetical protein [Spongospora subterranea]
MTLTGGSKLSSVTTEAVPSATAPSRKTIGLFDGVVFVLSCTIGSGLFFAPGESASAVQDAGVSLLAWLVAGLISLAGSLCYSELGTAFVSAGAESHYLNKAFGPSVSFTFTWAMITLVGSTAVAAISRVFGQYACAIAPSLITGNLELCERLVSVFVVIFLCVVNLVNPNYVLMLTRFNVVCKVVAVMIVVVGSVIAFFSGTASPDALLRQRFFSDQAVWTNFPQAVMFAVFAYSGWNMLNPLTEEMADPKKDVPRVYTVGMVSTIVLALLVNAAFMLVLPVDQMSGKLASPFATLVDPNFGFLRPVLCVFISFCCLGSCNGILMGTCKCMAAAGQSAILPASFGYKSKRHQVPFVSVIVFTIYSITLVFFDLNSIVAAYTVASWLFFVLVGISLFVLRSKYPNIVRPYKIHFYPFLPLVFIVGGAYILVMSCYNTIIIGSFCFGTCFVGLAMYLASKVDGINSLYHVFADMIKAPSSGNDSTTSGAKPVSSTIEL